MTKSKNNPKSKPASKAVDKLQEAAELIKADQERRETEAAKEYEQFLVYLNQKYNVKFGYSQPQFIIQAL